MTTIIHKIWILVFFASFFFATSAVTAEEFGTPISGDSSLDDSLGVDGAVSGSDASDNGGFGTSISGDSSLNNSLSGGTSGNGGANGASSGNGGFGTPISGDSSLNNSLGVSGGGSTGAGSGSGPGGLVPCEGTGCSTCDLITLGENILDWLIGVMLVIFAILIAVAGFGMVTSGGNPVAKTEAKKKIMNGFIGIILVLAAWLLVDTLMRALLAGGNGEISGYGPWSQIKCTTQTGTSALPGAPASPATACTPLSSYTGPDPFGVVWTGTDPGLKNCAQKFASDHGGTITSAHRPAQYQAHLREIHTKWCSQGLSANTDPNCSTVKSAVGSEFSLHKLKCSWPVATVSNHTGGLAVDISFPGTPPNTSVSSGYNLTWFGSGDPVHYTFTAGTSCP